jgi:hypothetical protein
MKSNKKMAMNSGVPEDQTIGKASKTLGFLRRNLGRCTTKTKATAYTTLVRPVLEYASPVWDPHQLV